MNPSRIENWTQSKIKIVHILLILFYFILSFLAPIIVTIILTGGSKYIDARLKLPITVIVVLCISIFGAAKYLIKYIDKIPVKNLDGSYSNGNFRIKMILRFICEAIVLIVGLIAIILIKSLLIANIQFYLSLLSWILGFKIAAYVIDAFCLNPVEFEIDIRKGVADRNMEQRRINNLANINK